MKKKTNFFEKKKLRSLKQLNNYFFYFLAKRNYSEKELREKAKNKFINYEDFIEDSIYQLIEAKYINHEQLIESYVRFKSIDMYGRSKILQDLVFKKGLEKDKVEEELEKYDWYEIAKSYKLEKIGDFDIKDYKLKNKYTNRMLSRGFSYDEIKYSFDTDD